MTHKAGLVPDWSSGRRLAAVRDTRFTHQPLLWSVLKFDKDEKGARRPDSGSHFIFRNVQHSHSDQVPPFFFRLPVRSGSLKKLIIPQSGPEKSLSGNCVRDGTGVFEKNSKKQHGPHPTEGRFFLQSKKTLSTSLYSALHLENFVILLTT